ncbi:UDP-glucose 4-epimerase GalE [Billgrantia kenyensis]|uniref:UDP-glucose 4-epimerase n=1 Tax=Billgrantia kenyensis TaxID=321266 RepID=A0A7V9W391_9GAMM|nr:UDP-glucose 4-epimerase GalE [Halomonas kenyensis]MBA2780243.1 UDP-glucose 4-epimerase GalE [Halomonas kenyensis]MCG6663101.1 UDP-glucose 4-epimerase GalE [Halomonas kenyensis]
MRILVTGGAGYIGSHTVLALLESGHEVLVLDNFSNSNRESLKRVEELSGKTVGLVEGDTADTACLEHLFREQPIDSVLHFAGFKSVGESMADPLAYYINNLAGTLALCRAMSHAGVYELVFSSSATIYGDGHPMPLQESYPAGQPASPYGRSKLMVEHVLQDLAASDGRWRIALLRYFNPIGAHPSGMIGDDPRGLPTNLVPFVSQVAVGRRDELVVYGNDYPTHDGTGVRDYLHVMDLAEGHLRAMEALRTRPGVNIWNLGTGQGHSVLEVIAAYERASNRHIPYRVESRRPGDIAAYWADPSKARAELDWQARRGLEEMVADTWQWQKTNPHGYQGGSNHE